MLPITKSKKTSSLVEAVPLTRGARYVLRTKDDFNFILPLVHFESRSMPYIHLLSIYMSSASDPSSLTLFFETRHKALSGESQGCLMLGRAPANASIKLKTTVHGSEWRRLEPSGSWRGIKTGSTDDIDTRGTATDVSSSEAIGRALANGLVRSS